MKKLFVLALSAIMILAFAAVSMAAVTTSGEVNFGFNLSGNDTLVPAAEFVTSDFGDAKVKVTADLNEEVTAFVALKGSTGVGVNVDEAWASFKEGFGTIKVGYFGWNVKQNLDILNTGMADFKSDAGINLDAQVAENVTVNAMLQRQEEDMDMGVRVGYTMDSLGASVGYAKAEAWDDALIALNGHYMLTDTSKVYLTYFTQGSDYSSAILGGLYDTDSLYARAEFEVVKPDGKDDSNVGFVVGYKLGNGAKVEYKSVTDYNLVNVADPQAVSSLKLNVVF